METNGEWRLMKPLPFAFVNLIIRHINGDSECYCNMFSLNFIL